MVTTGNMTLLRPWNLCTTARTREWHSLRLIGCFAMPRGVAKQADTVDWNAVLGLQHLLLNRQECFVNTSSLCLK